MIMKFEEVTTMTSRQIAEWTGKNHYIVMRDIRVQMKQAEEVMSCKQICMQFQLSEYKDDSGKMNPMYLLQERAWMNLITGYSYAARDRVNQEWKELKQAELDLKTRSISAERQKQCMALLAPYNTVTSDKAIYIKANTIANKATSNYFGYDSMVTKDDMTEEMIRKRDEILPFTINLFELSGDWFGVKEIVYNKYQQPVLTFESE